MVQTTVIKRGGKYYEQTRKTGGATQTKEISRQEGEAAFTIAKATKSYSTRQGTHGGTTFKDTNIIKPVVLHTVDTTGKKTYTPAGKAVQQIRQQAYFRGTNIEKPVILSIKRRGKTFVTKAGEQVTIAERRYDKAVKAARLASNTEFDKNNPNWRQDALKKGLGPVNRETYNAVLEAERKLKKELNGLRGFRLYRQFELENIKNKSASYPGVTINGVTYHARSKGEYLFFKNIKKANDRDAKFNQGFSNAQKALGLDIRDMDRWYAKFLKGAGNFGLALVYGGGFISSALAKLSLIIQGSRLDKGTKKAIAEEAGLVKGRAITEVRKKNLVGKQIDPTKPENWFLILAAVLGVAYGKGYLARVKTRFGRAYVPSVRNASAMEAALLEAKVKVGAAKILSRRGIKAGVEVAFETRRLARLNALERSINGALKTVRKVIKDPKVLKLIDMNPVIKTAKLIKNIGKERLVFHATKASFRDLFGQTYKGLKTIKEILAAVKKNSLKSPRGLAAKSGLEYFLVKQLRKARAVITGAKSQNAFVKSLLRRKTFDFDVIVKNNGAKAKQIVAAVKKQYPKAKVELSSFTKVNDYGQRMKVYQIKINGRKMVDLVDTKNVKNLKFTVTKDGDRLASPEYLARQKVLAIKDPKAAFRKAKDTGDLRRLVGSFFKDSRFIRKVKDPKNYLTVKAQPKGMGASRIKFGETQLFFDFEVPTGYAYNALLRNVIPKKVLQFLKNLKIPRFSKKTTRGVKLDGLKVFKDEFIKQLNNIKHIKASDRFTVLKVKTPISKFPARLAERIRLAARGKLSAKQATKLRIELNEYINKNPNKVFVGSRTGSKAIGEREVVLAEESKVVGKPGKVVDKVRRKVGIDPETKLFFDVIESGIKKAPKRVPFLKKIRAVIKELRKDKFASIRRRFGKQDLAKVWRFKYILKRTNKLTNPQYRDLISIIQKMLRSKKASKVKLVTKKGKANARRPTRVRVRGRRSSVRTAATALRGYKAPKTRRTFSKASARHETRKARIRPISRPRRPNRKPRPRRRPNVLPRSRTSTRPRNRARPRKRTRSRLRPPSPRPRPRARPRPRSRPRPRPRPRIRPRPRSRISPRQFQALRKRIPPRFRRRIKTAKDKKDLLEWFVREPAFFRPSLAAVILNITGYKIPKRITGFEIRPIIIPKR